MAEHNNSAVEFGPCFDDEMMDRIEAAASSNDLGITRRIALTLCARGSVEAEGIAADPDLFCHMLHKVRDFRSLLDDLVTVAKTAEARLEWAGERAGALPNGWRVLDGK